VNLLKLRMLIQQFFLEDIGDIDLTSSSIFGESDKGKGSFIAKETGVLSGLQVISEAYHLLDPSIKVKLYKRDNQLVQAGETIAEISGSINHLLTGERVILNLLQRMSGIATMTKACVDTLNSDHTVICDTRKTTPGLRMLEKYAVTCGGGRNHRSGLYDGVMIKDNHIGYCGSISKAVQAVREHIGHMVKIEVETENEAQVREAVKSQVDVIMFDNRSPEEVKAFVRLVPKSIITEASGGITLDRLADYRHTGVDYLSLGMLTHSTKALDISLNVSS
jgi:nicotinate-nucleotide pyrophosphorylase (carboxylating)